MRVLILAKSTPNTENAPHNSQGYEAMSRFTQELVSAGILQDPLKDAGALQPSSKGARVRFGRTKRTVIDGPFMESKELVAGYWIWQVQSLDEAIEWLKRAPLDDGAELEIRPVFEDAISGR